MDEQKEKNAQMTFDFGFASESEQDVEVVDIGDAEDLLGLPPADMPEGESLSFSMPEEELEEDEEDFSSGTEAKTENELSEEFSVSSDSEKESSISAEKSPEYESGTAVPAKTEKKLAFDAKNIRRSALAFLASLGADAVAADVPLRYRKYVVDAAACWCSMDSKKGLKVSRTCVAEVVMKETAFFTEKSKILPLLAGAKEELEDLKAKIREEEPSLQVCDTLFCEEGKWDYSRTKNPEYAILVSKISELERTLFKGTVFDRLRKNRSASEFYLVVPEDFIAKESVPEEWGLVYVGKDLSFRLVKEAGKLVSCAEDMNFLALNIARASLQNVLFANGIVKDAATCRLTRLPRKRRA